MNGPMKLMKSEDNVSSWCEPPVQALSNISVLMMGFRFPDSAGTVGGSGTGLAALILCT